MSLGHGASIVTNGLVLHLDAANVKSYPGSGTVWNDLSGQANHFTLYNSPTFNNNKFILNGVNNYFRSQNLINLSLTNAITLEIAFNPLTYTTGSGTFNMLIEATTNFNAFTTGFYTGYNDIGPGIWPYDISVNIRGNNGYNINAWDKGLFSSNRWCVFSPILDKTISSGARETIVYTDGVIRSSAVYVSGFNSDNTNNFGNEYIFVGARNGAQYFSNIELQTIKIYNRALSAAEIKQNFEALRGRYGV